MGKLIFVWWILAPHLSEGLHHQHLAKELEAANCRVDLSHYEWVEIDDPLRMGLFDFGTPVERQSMLAAWADRTPAHLLIRRIERVTIRGETAEQVDAALQTLAEIKSVPGISVYGTGFNVDHLKRLTGSVQVRTLYLRGVPLPHTALPALSHDGLTWLCVCHTHFSNPAIASLPESLEYLDATRTRINDEGLDGFLRLKNLKRLNLRRTPTTEAAVDRLCTQMPWCQISWEPLKRQ